MKKLIITVVGHDTVGIIAKVCTYLAENEVNILDISQTRGRRLMWQSFLKSWESWVKRSAW